MHEIHETHAMSADIDESVAVSSQEVRQRHFFAPFISILWYLPRLYKRRTVEEDL
jgi:hypothetical protein